MDDFTVGVLELAKEVGHVTKKDLKEFPLVYTTGGVVRQVRKSFGRPFKGPDGKHVLLG